MEQYDLVIVGAGIFGLPMAKTYLEVHPEARMLVLDANKSIGGTWSQERLYECLLTNNHVGMVEYSDFPMDFETFGVPKQSHVPGPVLHRYLTAYAQHFGVYDKIRFQALVKVAELQSTNDWIITYDWNDASGETRSLQLLAKKLIMATGTTSEPTMPSIPGMNSFEGEIFHTKDLPYRVEEMDSAKHVVILGGSKSAADAAYLNATKGRHVDWVIRDSGIGPGWMSDIYVSPAKISFEKLATSRIMSFLSASFDLDGYPRIRYLLHNTRLGRAFLRGFFGIINSDMIVASRYNDHPETKKLIPKANVMWYGTKVGIFNYPTSFFELIRQDQIHVHLSDIASISPHSILLSNSQSLEADLLICATGYDHQPLGNFTFLPSSIKSQTGILIDSPTSPSVVAADAEIMRRFPALKAQPACTSTSNLHPTPSWHLYRGVVPPSFISTQNLAYIGMAPSLRGFLVSEIQALWLVAFLSGKLSNKPPAEKEAEWDALLLNRFWRWRAPCGLGMKGPDLVMEILPYVDTLLRDLGLETQRKGGWRELFEWYGVGDYKGLVGEWVGKTGGLGVVNGGNES